MGGRKDFCVLTRLFAPSSKSVSDISTDEDDGYNPTKLVQSKKEELSDNAAVCGALHAYMVLCAGLRTRVARQQEAKNLCRCALPST